MSTPLRPPSAQALPSPGDVIAGKYELVRVLGEGGMGIVFEAMHLKLRQRVAVKMLLPEMLAHEVIITRFEREARAAGQLRNRHAARVVDVDTTPEGLPYMVMELLEGHDLELELTRRGALPPAEVVDYILQACSAMAEAHQLGIVHRDLKPANLFLETDGDARIVKVLDFGISKLQSEADSKLTAAESVMGTAIYMSPEQVRSTREVDARSDIWSLGIILYELIAGQPPWTGTPTQLAAMIVSEDAPDLRTVSDVPPGLAETIKRALKRDPRERFADVKQLALALAPYAPPSGVGRMLAEAWLSTSSRRLPLGPVAEQTRTLIQPGAPGRELSARAETAPGWSQPSDHGARKRLPTRFIVGLLAGPFVLGGLGVAWKWRAVGHEKEVVASPAAATTSAAPSASAPSASAPSAPSAVGAVVLTPVTPSASPAVVVPPASAPMPSAVSASGRAPSLRGPSPSTPNARPLAAPAAPPLASSASAPPKPTPPKPRPEQVGNPLLL